MEIKMKPRDIADISDAELTRLRRVASETGNSTVIAAIDAEVSRRGQPAGATHD